MSWQDYVDKTLLETGHFDHAAIYGQAGGTWATSPDFNVTAQQQADLINGFDNNPGIQSAGIYLADCKYLTIYANERSIYGKKSQTGCVCVKTKAAVIVTVYKPGTQPGEATKCTEALGDYLIQQGL